MKLSFSRLKFKFVRNFVKATFRDKRLQVRTSLKNLQIEVSNGLSLCA